MPNCYWWRGDDRTGPVTNLGDALSPVILKHFCDIDVTWSPPHDADIICTGSVLDVMPRSNWHGIMVGAGQLQHDTLTDLSFATVMGLRGTLTRERVQCGDQTPVIGDPVLLAPELVNTVPNAIEIGVIPHWTDRDLWLREQAKAMKYKYAMPTLIELTDDPLKVISLIGSCRKVVTSSLHGIVVADAFGIPRRAEMAPSMLADTAHEGGGMKWADYSSALGIPMEFGRLVTAPQVRISQIQYDLFGMFQALKERYA